MLLWLCKNSRLTKNVTVILFQVLVDVRTYQLLVVGRRLLLSYLGPRAVPLQHDQLASQIQHDALCHAGLSWTQTENMNANAAIETVQFSVLLLLLCSCYLLWSFQRDASLCAH